MAAVNASTGGTEEFGGDEFSNNLFSDLAPLLTLFGEQVTKQFLSMSLGWADNILLAMGPLGIMTVIVSAIRVGGVRQLKAIVGRARESQLTAEQELLSSTSVDVCELWNGKEIVRLMGSTPAGMKTLVIVGNKTSRSVLDIATAVKQDFLESPGLLSSIDTNDTLHELSEAAPNLALNVKNATAKPLELWVCATIGVALQTVAIVFPGLATYHWKLEKAGTPVPAYGYPCFLIGTLLVVMGVAACGHVIEGITTEHYFTAKRKAGSGYLNVVQKVVWLQRSCTVSDQHFSSFLIENSPDDFDIRTSRLNKKDYSPLAATATIAAIVGFIAQFIGLRALHWSATIVQLGVTVLMTGIRSYVRRGLATNPICSGIPEGNEAVWLAIKISRDLQLEAESTKAAVRKKSILMRIKQLFTARLGADAEPLTDAPVFLEPPSLRYQLEDLESLYERLRSTASRPSLEEGGRVRCEQMMDKIEEVKQSFIFFKSMNDLEHWHWHLRYGVGPDDSCHPPATEVDIHHSIQVLMPQNDLNSVVAASKLSIAIERVATKCAGIDGIRWMTTDSEGPVSSFVTSLPIFIHTLGGPKTHKYVRLSVRLVQKDELNRMPPSWGFEGRGTLRSVLSLWQSALAERERVFQQLSSDAHAFDGREMNDREGTVYVRVVGHAVEPARNHTELDDWLYFTQDFKVPLQDWLGKRVLRSSSSLGVLGAKQRMLERKMGYPLAHDWPVFGAFVSELSSEIASGDYYIYTDRRTDLIMQCAHEILSLVMFTIASKIEKVGGETRSLPEARPTDGSAHDNTLAPRTMVNSIFREIAEEIVDCGMAHDITEAYTLIIPAFNHYGLLPTRADNEVEAGPVVDEAALVDDEYRNDNLDGGAGGAEGA
ncbi:hypothetical protein QBC39DRAFT_354441 [Podospora conica]|nr:hypothetical protein QBC39DRAFT_354441 [Schizothecium conicum]